MGSGTTCLQRVAHLATGRASWPRAPGFGHTLRNLPLDVTMPLPSRATARQTWTCDALDDPSADLQRASADASFRSYWRTCSAGRSWIVMDAPPALEDIRPWLDVAQRLNAVGLHAP